MIRGSPYYTIISLIGRAGVAMTGDCTLLTLLFYCMEMKMKDHSQQ